MAREVVAVTFNVELDTKTNFKLETIQNSQTMSEVVESFMIDYCKVSVQLREERIIREYEEKKQKKLNNGEE